MSKPLDIIVIGAGICGLSTAIWLRRAGHGVTLIDKDHPGAGASYGNAGLLAQWAIVPMNTPDLRKTAFKYLTSADSPLFMQWSALPTLMPWLWQFFRNATPAGNAHMTGALTHILTDSVAQHRALTKGTRAEDWIADSTFSYAYADRKAFEADAAGWEVKRRAGFVPEIVEGQAVQEIEPILGPETKCLAILNDHGHILNPGAYMEALARVLEDEGGTYRQAEAQDIELTGGKVTAVLTDQGRMTCDRAVLAAGIWSKPLMRKLGLKVPLVAERGYHLHFTGPSQMPNNPMMMTQGKFAVNPMASGLRCAGTVELGDTTKGPSRGPRDLIARNVKRLFPALEYEDVEEWMGFRPSTPDSLPLIGEINGTGVHAAFGHQHIGLTAGPKTGRIVAALIDGQPPNIDLAPYDANRF
ncbi:NAD(P)/FAD-dependent oxidoreductase [Roseovarius indicus]|uniref:NAD(P)/FAD-dependent oxidoreductase n=1 Tax=Roseovarius indicus TaxID=540747 RepID=UPI004058A574